MGFAFCKREGDRLETVMPISPCKDYLNDIVYSEATGKPFRAYGLETKKLGIFEGECAYMAVSVCKDGATAKRDYEGFDEEVASLKANHPKIAWLLQAIEGLLRIEGKTIIYPAGDERFITEVPLFWVRATYLISLYTLIFRNGHAFDGQDPIQYLRAIEGEDSLLMRDSIPKLEKMIAAGAPAQNWEECRNWHNYGIRNFEFPHE